MIRRSLAFVLLGVLAGTAAEAQTPGPGGGAQSKVFSMIFDGDSGYLGIQTQDISRENLARFGLREVRGVGIEKVIDGSPAQAAGLQNGDVIIRMNGEEITSVRKLTRLLSETAPDHQVRLTVLRNGTERETTATLGKRPMPKFEEGLFSGTFPGQSGRWEFPTVPPVNGLPDFQTLPKIPEGQFENFNWQFGSRRQIGIGVTPLTKQLSDHFGVASGVMVNNVRENSPAAKAGLKAGDIIVEADGNEVKGDNDLVRAIGEKKTGDVTLTVVRSGSRQTIRVTPEEVKGQNNFFELPDGNFQDRMKLVMPNVPSAPLQLNQFFIPGRIL